MVPPCTYWKHLYRVRNPTINGLIGPKLAFSYATIRYMHTVSPWYSTRKHGTLAPNFTVYLILILIPVNVTSSSSPYGNIRRNYIQIENQPLLNHLQHSHCTLSVHWEKNCHCQIQFITIIQIIPVASRTRFKEF